MSLPQQGGTGGPEPDLQQYRYFTTSELNRCAKRAEHFMNRGLERRQWDAVRVHREAMVAATAELRRRKASANAGSAQVVIKQVW